MMAGSKSLYFHGTLVPVTKSFHHFKCCALQSTAKSVLSSSSSLDESLLDSVSIPTCLLFTLAVRAAFDSTSCFFNISTRCLYSLCTNEKMITIKTFSLCSEWVLFLPNVTGCEQVSYCCSRVKYSSLSAAASICRINAKFAHISGVELIYAIIGMYSFSPLE